MAQSKGDRRFPRTSHLRRNAQFQRNRRTGRRLHSKHFVLCVSRGPEPDCRLGLVVSKKVGTAVERNRVKRVLREVFRLERHGWPRGLDIVVIARPGAALLGCEQASAEIADCMARFAAGSTP